MDKQSEFIEFFLRESYINSISIQSNFSKVKDSYKNYSNSYQSNLNKCKSPIERIFYGILENTQICNVSPQQRIGNYIVDFLVNIPVIGINIIFECDGHDFHEKTKEQAQRDKSRDRYLKSQGYDVYRFTGSEIYNSPFKVMIEVGEILKRYCEEYQK